MVAIPELRKEAAMGRKTKRHALSMDDGQRARILPCHEEGLPLADTARKAGVSRPTVCRCIGKALAKGVESALRDFPRPGREPEITAGAKV